MNIFERDKFFMNQALDLARNALAHGEVPIGCLLVDDNDRILGTGFNKTITCCDPTAHAEIVALRQACQHEKNYRLSKSVTAYVTLEPCLMCAGAFLHARLERLVIAAKDSRAHSIHKTIDLYSGQYGNHKISVEPGLCAIEAQEILTQFFKDRR
jgi:tRNA(adenine34) deaminase